MTMNMDSEPGLLYTLREVSFFSDMDERSFSALLMRNQELASVVGLLGQWAPEALSQLAMINAALTSRECREEEPPADCFEYIEDKALYVTCRHEAPHTYKLRDL
jgi:hypothetical protein